MSGHMSNETKKTLFSIGIGTAAGILMSIVVLWMLIADTFSMQGMLYILAVVAGAALPLCLGLLAVRLNFTLVLGQIVMIIVSFCITLIYGIYVGNATMVIAGSSGLFLQVLETSGLLHVIALAAVGTAYVFEKRKKQD